MTSHTENMVKSLLISKDLPIKQAMRCMSDLGQKQLFVIDEDEKLFGAISDGDIRKWILSEGSLTERVDWICNKKPKSVAENFHINEVKEMMVEYKIEAIPVLDAHGEVKEILLWDDVFAGKAVARKEKLDLPIVIMAGGKGTRLDPFTKVLPKPLIPVGDKPILKIIIDKFSEYNINEFFITINHKSKMIKSYFEDTEEKNKIKFIEEKKPLGTAGGLSFLKTKIEGPFIVTNCDIIIDSDYSELVNFHKINSYDLTMVVSCRHYMIPYGVCEIENGGVLKRINEKPEYDLLVNTGMYVLNSDILEFIPNDQFFNITDLITVAKAQGCKIGVFPINEKSWIDVGQWEEYRKAVKEFGV